MADFLVVMGYHGAFEWPLPALFKRFEAAKKMEGMNIAKVAMAHRAAIVGANSKEGAESFNEYIKQLTGAEHGK